MCLNTYEYCEEEIDSVIGYKVFGWSDIPSYVMSEYMWEYYKIGKVYRRKKDIDSCIKKPPYEPGFHIFVDLIDAREWCGPSQEIYKVEGRGVYIEGTQNHSPSKRILDVIVAKRMKVIERVI